MRKLVIVLSFMMFCISLRATPTAGWDKAQFGMSQEQIMSIYKADNPVKSIKDKAEFLVISSKKVGDKTFRVVFRFDNKKLSDITLVLNPGYFDDFDKFSIQLSEKYGSPVDKTEKKVLWVTSSMNIELAVVALSGMNYVTISYKIKKDNGL